MLGPGIRKAPTDGWRKYKSRQSTFLPSHFIPSEAQLSHWAIYSNHYFSGLKPTSGQVAASIHSRSTEGSETSDSSPSPFHPSPSLVPSLAPLKWMHVPEGKSLSYHQTSPSAVPSQMGHYWSRGACDEPCCRGIREGVSKPLKRWWTLWFSADWKTYHLGPWIIGRAWDYK